MRCGSVARIMAETLVVPDYSQQHAGSTVSDEDEPELEQVRVCRRQPACPRSTHTRLTTSPSRLLLHVIRGRGKVS